MGIFQQAVGLIGGLAIFNQSHIILLMLILTWSTIVEVTVLIELAFCAGSIKQDYTLFKKESNFKVRAIFYGVFIWMSIMLWVCNPFVIIEHNSDLVQGNWLKFIFIISVYLLSIVIIVLPSIVVQIKEIEVVKYNQGHLLERIVCINIVIFYSININIANQLHQQLSVYLQHIIVMIIIAGITTGVVKLFQWKS